MPPGQRGRGRGGSSGSFGGRGGNSSRGRGGARGRGGGGRGRGGIRSFENRPRDSKHPAPSEDEASSDEQVGAAHNAPGSGSESESEDDDAVLSTEDEEEPEDTSAKPYNVLLQSLTLSRKSKDTRDAKRRKTQHVVEAEEEDPEEEWAPVDEEGAEEEEEQQQDGGDSDDEDQSDPFESHFATPTPSYLARTKAAEANSWETKKLTHPALSGKLVFSAPSESQAAPGKKVDSIADVSLKNKLAAPFEALNGEFTPVQQALAPYIFANQDVLFTSRTPDNAAAVRNLACVHALNHIYKTRSRVLKNNERLSRAATTDDGAADLELRDQGFTRPKVLFLLPTRNACAEVVNTLLALSQAEQQENKKRFTDSFTLPPSEERIPATKPADFRELFSGNHDDLFRLGLKFTRKSVKLFSQFYTSDIILASPLGLRMVLGDEGDRKRDYDFLSSLELVVVDHADALLMQNWEHVEHVFKHLNLIPTDAHGCDFGRVRSWYLDSQARFVRQTLVTATFLTPEINALFAGHMRSIAGRVKTAPEYAGAMTDLGLQVRQTFMRFDARAPAQDADARFAFFAAMVLPGLQRSAGGSVVFVHSYYDFVRVRNHLDGLGLDFGVVSEETAVGAVARARSHFRTGRLKVLLYTGRAHHFRRYEVAGAREVVFYQVPDNERFYREVAGGWLARSVREGMAEAGTCRVRVLFSRWDVLRLERVVGSKRVGVMCTDVGDTFEFV
ncbi:DUF1253-domain-containing protein [Morchella conica CCBAS932]|uniref:U3 small nucleolar RNA-associated protein 25 n=1 Tax=Morchella conica CCBAS932 TaxID=1392247 RepID=A0A3N4KLM9_9PEZI|nr:DUF1253-domain-containing protein [Morchella conica CCBAS932]